MTAYRLTLDAAACDGHGICLLRCPDRIGLDRWGFPVVDAEPLDAPPVIARARRAVAACPEGALHLEPLAGGTAPAQTASPRPDRAGGWRR